MNKNILENNFFFCEKIKQRGGQPETWSQRFKGVLSKLLIALLVVLIIAGFLIGGLYILGSLLGLNFIVRFVSWFCKNKWLYIILNLLPMILEIVGLVLSFIAVGVPIVGVGMFVEILVIVCDFIRKDPGWQSDVALGIFGLVPIIGLLGNGAKLFRVFRKIF